MPPSSLDIALLLSQEPLLSLRGFHFIFDFHAAFLHYAIFGITSDFSSPLQYFASFHSFRHY
jgi:hypothetical protein